MSRRIVEAEGTATIGRPATTVFHWLTDPTLLPQWVTGLVESRADGEAEVRLGARSVERISLRGKVVAMPAEIVELDAPHLVASRIETPDGPLVSKFMLADLANACSVTQKLTAEFSGHRWIPSVLLRTGMTRQVRQDLARLAALVEAAP